ncbi:MAG TPA: flagellar basal body L-ring protein FlgH [Bryobacteraceae bacterium]|nr:flagellar basal body L-ring protein FlgH [Bryobacteraceae bacterium]
MKRLLCAVLLIGVAFGAKKKEKADAVTPLDQYITEAQGRAAEQGQASPGSIWSPASRLTDTARDLRASQVDDIVTILVAEKASAVASGVTKTSRASSTKNSIAALGGLTRAAGPWANLAGISGDTELSGQGTTSRDIVLNTTLTARVTHVLPSGAMVLESSKDIQINSERQTITVRGVVRPADIGPDNSVQSDRLADLEVRVNGKGVVGDAIRRPFFLYRLLLGILPF